MDNVFWDDLEFIRERIEHFNCQAMADEYAKTLIGHTDMDSFSEAECKLFVDAFFYIIAMKTIAEKKGWDHQSFIIWPYVPDTVEVALEDWEALQERVKAIG